MFIDIEFTGPNYVVLEPDDEHIIFCKTRLPNVNLTIEFNGLSLPERSMYQTEAFTEKDLAKGYTKVIIHEIFPHLSGIYKCFVEGNETIFDSIYVHTPGKMLN